VKQKFITFGIEANSLREAKPRLERIEADIINNFKMLGVQASSLNGAERLTILHGQLPPDGLEKLRFDWKDLPRSGLSTRDYIAPTSFDFRGYYKFFLLDELVNEDTGEILFWLPFTDFGKTAPLPADVAEYREYMNNTTNFVKARNLRILKYASSL
jgi:hypothetical protein